MPAFSIIHVGVYRHEQTLKNFTGAPMLGLMVSGVLYRRVVWPDGRELSERNLTPRFSLEPAGTGIDFQSNSQRENWVVQLRTNDVRYNTRLHRVELYDGNEWFAFPHSVDVPSDRLIYWRHQHERLREAWASPVPRDRLWARLTVHEIFQFMLDQRPPAEYASPAAHLKSLIDEDAEHRLTLAQLTKACGYSPTHLRVLFEREYSLSPLAYRNQRRITRVMELVTSSTLSVKQIARGTGFRHVSHLSNAFREAMGMTVTEAIAQHRRG